MLTAEELGITEEIRQATIQVMYGLESGEFTHCPGVGEEIETQRNEGKWFGMQYWGKNKDCRTVRCIGGWIDKILDRQIEYCHEESYERMHPLFYPPGSIDWDSITPQMAALAIRRFLADGTINWHEIPGVQKVGILVVKEGELV